MYSRGFVFGGLAVVLMTASSAFAQDKVEFKDPNTQKVNTVSGNIKEESVAGIKILVGGTTPRDIPASQIESVTYDDLPRVLIIEYGQIQTAEAANDYEKALQGYKEVRDKIPASTNARKYVNFRIGMLEAALGREEAKNTLKGFIDANPDSWQFSQAALTLARLQLAGESYSAALDTLQKLSDAPGLPPELKRDVDLLVIDTLIRSDQVQKAAQEIDAALKGLPPANPHRQRLEVYKLLTTSNQNVDQKVKALEKLVAESDDPSLKALAYNTMGDLYASAQRERDAMWSYLWVDVVFNGDEQEHLKAVDRLAKLFKAMNDTDRAAQYEEKLQRLR